MDITVISPVETYWSIEHKTSEATHKVRFGLFQQLNYEALANQNQPIGTFIGLGYGAPGALAGSFCGRT